MAEEQPTEFQRLNIEENTNDVIATQEGPKAKTRQIYYACSAHLGAFIMATVWSWSSTALPSLRESETFGEITIWEESWIASITFLAGAVGSFFMGSIAERFGLKKSLVIATFPLFLGWLLVGFARNMSMILIGRFITGFFVAGVGVSNALVAEYSNPKRRGQLNFLFDMLFCCGVLFIYIIGTFFSWKVQALSCSFICVVFFVLLLVIPESPNVLIRQKKENEAAKALKYFRDNNTVKSEINAIAQTIRRETSETGSTENLTFIEQLKSEFETCTSMPVLKPIFIAIALQFFLQVCGVVPIVCYAVDVFKDAGTAQVHENTSTIVLGAINLIATFAAYFIVDKFGRRTLMMGSEAFLTLTLFILGIFLYFKETSSSSLDKFSWFPLACMVVYITAYSFGVGPLPWVVMGEIVNPAAKGFSSGIIILSARVFGFFVMFFFKDMMEIWGQHGTYWFFAAVCLLGLLFTFLLLPETKGRTLEEIQRDLEGAWFQHKKISPNDSSYNT